MKVLVTAASRHGSTAEIASIIAGILQASDIDAEAVAPEAVASVDGVRRGHPRLSRLRRSVAGVVASLRRAARRRPRDTTGLPVLQRPVGLSIASSCGTG